MVFERPKLVHSSGGRGKALAGGKIKIKTILLHFGPISTISLTFHHNFNPYIYIPIIILW